ncbi:MAG TPA: serine/threonine-protein kinase [Armatimonadota bacterium]|jgi:hypothetical protein
MAVSANKLGRYELRREIARSNDVVYEAADPGLGRRVAVKEMVMPPGFTGAAAKDRLLRFHREARAAGALTHPNIVTVYEVGEDLGRHFIAMEYLEGPTLREEMMGGHPFPAERAAQIAAQIADALAYAHRHGVVHRDVKPDNIHLVTPTTPKLTDFGIARIQSEINITVSGQVFGTPSYMSPEQVAGGDIDARTDIFSLGVVLFEMVAGRKPFQGDSVVTITYNIVNQSPDYPPSIPPWLAGILRKALAKRPEDRYSTAAEMAEDLRARRAPGGYAAQTGAWPQPLSAAAASAHAWQPGIAPPGSPRALAQPIYVYAEPPRGRGEGARVFAIAVFATLCVAMVVFGGLYFARMAFDKQHEIEAAHQLDALRTQSGIGPSTPASPLGAPSLSQPVAPSIPGPGAALTPPTPTRSGSSQNFGSRARAEYTDGRRLISEGRVPEGIARLDAALADVNAAQTIPDASIRSDLARLYLDLSRQAGPSGSVGGASAYDLCQRAEQADPVGPVGDEARRAMTAQ